MTHVGEPGWVRERFASARVGRLATVTPDGRPHVVPVVFVLVHDASGGGHADGHGDMVWTAVDDKPKTTRALARLANIRATPAVSLLVDEYDDDWSRLWWVRLDGTADVLDGADPSAEVPDPDLASVRAALAAKYPPYRLAPPAGPFIRIRPERWVSWAASGVR